MKPERVLETGWGIVGASLAPLGSGHINDTLLATVPGGPPVVLQRINTQVFTDPARVMANLARVQAHLDDLAPGLIPPLIDSLDGRGYFRDTRGGWWRLWAFLPDGRTIEQTRDPDVCRAAAHAFGRFQRLLEDLPGPPLEPTIAGFLELDGYLQRFDQVRASAAGAEAAIAEACGDPGFIEAHRELAAQLPKGEAVIHGDCKLNNLLFGANGTSVRAVLDLDTIMVGHWAWDFGDLARSVLTGAFADDQWSDGAAARGLFSALVEGFQAGRQKAPDARLLSLAPVYVAFMLGIRFLTDHLEGDRYFRVNRRGENLLRARRQFSLIEKIPVGDYEEVARKALAG